MLAAVSPRRFKSANHPHSERIALMFRQPTTPQLSYLEHQAKIDRYVQQVLRERDRIGSTHWDNGTPEMLGGDHMLMIRSRGDVHVTILAHWFCHPTFYTTPLVAPTQPALPRRQT